MELRNIKLAAFVGGIILLLVIIVSAFPVAYVPAGSRGVVFNNFSGIENRVLGEGTHFRIPFAESIIVMPIRTQVNSFDEKGADSAGTQDSQQVDLKVTINWHLDPAAVQKVYQEVGDNDAIISKVLTNNTQDSIKQAVSKYAALDVQKNRDTVAKTALALLQEKVVRYHIVVENLSLTNINFSSDFNAAVEAAQVANQNAIAAQNKVAQIKAEAEAAIAKANGEAEAQKLVQQSLTPELLQKMFLEKWNGVLPVYTGGGNPVPFLNIGK